MAMLELLLLVIRGVQALFAIIVLGCTAYVADVLPFSEDSFLLFTAVWTLLALLYLGLAPKLAPNATIPAAILGVDALTMLFWFAGFIAQAVVAGRLDGYSYDSGYIYAGYGCGRWCGSIKASAAFGAFNWVLFLVTTVFAALNVFRGKNKTTTTHSGAPMTTA